MRPKQTRLWPPARAPHASKIFSRRLRLLNRLISFSPNRSVLPVGSQWHRAKLSQAVDKELMKEDEHAQAGT